MSELSETKPTSKNPPAAESNSSVDASKSLFIRRWGELSGYWGISRTMAEIHALLLVSTEPVCTDNVMDKLLISRGNASMNLRLLVDWGLIEKEHIRGDRKEYFTCRTDVWEMFETILRQRRRREVEPIIETIDRCVEMVGESKDAPGSGESAAPAEDLKVYRERLKGMQDFLKTMGSVMDMLVKIGPKGMSELSRSMAGMAG